ncbi:MHO_1590 family protein [Mycoplasmopsis iners]|uniref:MHO_1590 family protein n=1 Tax=Mycoplasmopsis iners TaxID=76630 RepID=UPI000496F974|nr:hypothetical protein [Mycoplasmopsis iners]
MKFKWTLKKKLLVFGGAFGCLAAIALPVALVTSNKTKLDKQPDQPPINKGIYREDMSIFPDINLKNYYSFVKIVENESYLDDKIVPFFMNDIVANFKTSQGRLNFDYERKSPQEIDIKLQWTNDIQTLSRIYKLSVSLIANNIN